MTDAEIIARWEACLAEADAGTDAEYDRALDELKAWLKSDLHASRVIAIEYARQFPDGPPEDTPLMSATARQEIADFVVSVRAQNQ